MLSYDNALNINKSELPGSIVLPTNNILNPPSVKRWIRDSLYLTSVDKINKKIKSNLIISKELLLKEINRAYDNILNKNIPTIIKTFIATANSEAMKNIYNANTDIIKKVKWLATLDFSCCVACGALDSREYPINSHPNVPLHPRCRCVLIPVTISFKELGLDINEIKTNYRPMLKTYGNINNRTILSYGRTRKNFSEVFDTLSEREKLNIVGKSRLDLLNTTKLKYRDLVDPFSGKILNLKEINSFLNN